MTEKGLKLSYCLNYYTCFTLNIEIPKNNGEKALFDHQTEAVTNKNTQKWLDSMLNSVRINLYSSHNLNA